eukprot:NODE_80_length_3362_cov_39.792272_g74_i0.p1 GENE.NODE_80_length_3362_cov_39.792272_g74_i0~~NODE_80_length_3362_cov_39.792272_g74_i0.p1  ORF type:complete len:1087 (+),score=384.97 NODE_80_length_3362_cov_39.792272_g74_i0:46-3261(+)
MPDLELGASLCDRAFAGDLKALQEYCEAGVDMNLKDYNDRTALHLAAAAGHLQVVEWLVHKGCLMQRDQFGGLPLHDAERNEHSAVKDFLKELSFKKGGQDTRPTAKLMDKVLSILVKEGVFTFSLVYSELDYYFNVLDLDHRYFEHYTAAQIAKHVHCYIAAKKVAQTSGTQSLQFHMESEQKAFYLSTIGDVTQQRADWELTEQLVSEWLQRTPAGHAYSVVFIRSRAPAFRGAKDALGIYSLHQSPFESAGLLPDEDDLELVATTSFLKTQLPHHCKRFSELIKHVMNSSSGTWTKATPVQARKASFPSASNWVLEYGTRQTSPVFLQEFSQIFRTINTVPTKRYVETFQNGITCYTFYLDCQSKEAVDSCVRQLQLVPHLKQSPIAHLFPTNVLGGDTLIFLTSLVKFAFHFVKKETPEYLHLAQALSSEPRHKAKLDLLYLQAMTELLTEDRIFEVVLRYVEFCKTVFTDFKHIATGARLPYYNTALAKQLDNIRDETDVKVLQAFLLFNQHLLLTNFFRAGGTSGALAFRLNPQFLATLSTSIFPELPYGVFLVVGRDFYGFHVRFRDIARGGIRLIYSRDQATYRRNASTLFEENYNLAFTQQRKNKDIPEGGAKGTILLDLGAQHLATPSFEKYIDSLLDLMMPEENQIHSHHGKPEYLFFGPDENTADKMDMGSLHARKRGWPLWKSLTTGKAASMGGIPHDVYGMTTRSVHTFKCELLLMLGLKEEQMSKVQIGGPDGDLGSNEIKISRDKTIAIVDGSGVAYDPQGLDRAELLALATRRLPIKEFSASKLSGQGFLVLVGELDITLPDGTVVERGDQFRDTFHLSKYSTADLFVPCGGRPKSVTSQNVHLMFQDGKPKFRCVVEGANLFLTDDARKTLEDAGVSVLKDASTNKGGVTCSSLEVLAALALTPAAHDALMCVTGVEPPAFYTLYVRHIQQMIQDKARMEFRCLWAEKQRHPEWYLTDLTAMLSNKINAMADTISAQFEKAMDPQLAQTVLRRAFPTLLVDRVGVAALMDTLPLPYVHAAVAGWLAATFVYERGFSSNEFAFYKFMERLKGDP